MSKKEEIKNKVEELTELIKCLMNDSGEIEGILRDLNNMDIEISIGFHCLVKIPDNFSDEEELSTKINDKDKEFLQDIGAIW